MIVSRFTNHHLTPTVSQSCSDDVFSVSGHFGCAVMQRSSDRSESQLLGLHRPLGVKQISFHYNFHTVLVTFQHKGLDRVISNDRVWFVGLIQRVSFKLGQVRERQEKRFGLISVTTNCFQVKQNI